ncbi:MAG: DUF2188 domain-containing protein [Ignavibacteria bacterium]|jgi:hypothetical protein
MAKRETHHVVPNKERGGWDVKKGGSEKAIKHFDKKQDAVDHGRQISINQKTEFIIHRKDGIIQKADSHGGDPNPPKDKK